MASTPFWIINRKQQLVKLLTKPFNLAIIGRVITGAGIALEASSREFKVYDFLADVEDDNKGKMLGKKKTLRKEPRCEHIVLGGGYYSEYRTYDARITAEKEKMNQLIYDATHYNDSDL